MKKIVLAILVAVGLMGMWTVGYGQPYEPEHLLHLCGDAEQVQYFGHEICGIGDVNGDGFGDFIASMYPIGSSLGSVFDVYHGGSPPDTIPDIVFRNPYSHGGFDLLVFNVGDVNGDYDDDIATQGGYTSENLSRVFVYYGGSSLDTTPDVELTNSPAWDFFGSQVYGLGDVNGDDFNDIGVYASNYQQSSGKVWVYFGGNPMDTIPDWEKAGSGAYHWFGGMMAGGDLNGDDYSDLVIHEYVQEEEYSNIYIFFGSTEMDTIPDITLSGSVSGYLLGGEIAIIEDLNGDDFADLLLGTYDPMSILVFFGGSPFQPTPDAALTGLYTGDSEWHISRAGDVNADGYGDIIVGQNGNEGVFGGKVLVYFGGSWVNPNPMIVWTGWGQPWEGCGERVTDPGDLNGDGVDDIMFSDFNSFNQPGCVEIWLGDSGFVAGVGNEEPGLSPPDEYRLLPPFPNPFNQSVTIPLQVPGVVLGKPSVRIYNVLGQEVVDLTEALANGLSNSGSGQINLVWNGRDWQGMETGSGIYFICLTWGSSFQVSKVVLLR